MALVKLTSKDADGAQKAMVIDTVQNDSAVVKVTPDFPDAMLAT